MAAAAAIGTYPDDLFRWSFTNETIRALTTNSQDRGVAARQAIEASAGQMHCDYSKLGEHDGVAVADFTDTRRAMQRVKDGVGESLPGA